MLAAKAAGMVALAGLFLAPAAQAEGKQKSVAGCVTKHGDCLVLKTLKGETYSLTVSGDQPADGTAVTVDATESAGTCGSAKGLTVQAVHPNTTKCPITSAKKKK